MSKSLGKRELALLRLFEHCELGMSPRAFYNKWDITQEQMAVVCDRSISTVRGWFRLGSRYRAPTAMDCRQLALLDFWLEFYEEIPVHWRDLLCR